MYLKPFSLLLRNALRLGKHKGQKLDEDFQSILRLKFFKTLTQGVELIGHYTFEHLPHLFSEFVGCVPFFLPPTF
jgi:hypothetical protein